MNSFGVNDTASEVASGTMSRALVSVLSTTRAIHPTRCKDAAITS
jgi:hypothetical protein